MNIRAFDLVHIPEIGQGLEHGAARGKAIQALPPAGVSIEMGVFIKDVYDVEPMALGDGEVQRIMGRSCFDGSGSEPRVHFVVGDDGHPAVGEEGMFDVSSDDPFVTLVVGMNGHACVPEHRLDTRGGNRYVTRTICQRLSEGDKFAGHLFVVHLDIGQSGRATRAPVDNSIAAIDDSFVEPAHKDGPHRP